MSLLKLFHKELAPDPVKDVPAQESEKVEEIEVRQFKPLPIEMTKELVRRQCEQEIRRRYCNRANQ